MRLLKRLAHRVRDADRKTVEASVAGRVAVGGCIVLSESPERLTEVSDRQVERPVYELNGLTHEEMGIVGDGTGA